MDTGALDKHKLGFFSLGFRFHVEIEEYEKPYERIYVSNLYIRVYYL